MGVTYPIPPQRSDQPKHMANAFLTCTAAL
jgi:hypothetical protein